jgi:hypothetical protein
MTNQVIVILLVVLGVVASPPGGYALLQPWQSTRRRRDRDAEETLSHARIEAQRILAKAEEEGRAKAEAYREREEASRAPPRSR